MSTEALPGSVADARPKVDEAPKPRATDSTSLAPLIDATPSFTELVYAHFEWMESPKADERADAYRRTRRAFEQRHGDIVDEYWCSKDKSAIALTERRRRFRATPLVTFHRETDWATRRHAAVGRELHRCEELAICAQIVLSGMRRRICLQHVASAAAHLLSLADPAAAPADEKEAEQGLRGAREALDRAGTYYRDAANGQAQFFYFVGMVVMTGVIAAAAGVTLLAGGWRVGVVASVAGAVGAVVSVTQRINANDFDLQFDMGRWHAFFVGGLRPFIGGAFAIAISLAFDSGMLHLPVPGSGDNAEANSHLALAAIGFVAGFSERWAQDTLAAAVPLAGEKGETNE